MAGGDLVGCFSENSHRDRWRAQLLPTRRGDRITSVWKVLSAGVLRSLAWMLQVMMRAWEKTDLGDSRFLSHCLLPEALGGSSCMGSIFRLQVVPGTLSGSHEYLTFMDCVLHLALAGERAEVNPA